MAKRGSDSLLKRCSMPLSEDVIGKLESLIAQQGARLIDWECVGQPNPDAVLGVAHAGSIDEATNVLREIVDLEPRFTFEIFPRGIPAPEFFEVHFRTPGFGR